MAKKEELQMAQAIKDALLKLDVNNNDHWTADGLPKVDALDIAGLKRADITAVAPQFTRENPTLELPPETQADEDEAQKQIDEAMAAVMDHFQAVRFDAEQEDEGAVTVFTLFNAADEEVAKGALHELEELMLEPEEEDETDGEGIQEDSEDAEEADIQEGNAKEEEQQQEEVELTVEQQLELAKVNLEAKEQALHQATKDLDKARIDHDRLVDALIVEQRGHTTQHDIMHYIATQNRLRAERAAKHNQFMKQGFDPARTGPAPIDQALSRKNTRPVRAPVKKD